jgi:hypothetical protein
VQGLACGGDTTKKIESTISKKAMNSKSEVMQALMLSRSEVPASALALSPPQPIPRKYPFEGCYAFFVVSGEWGRAGSFKKTKKKNTHLYLEGKNLQWALVHQDTV